MLVYVILIPMTKYWKGKTMPVEMRTKMSISQAKRQENDIPFSEYFMDIFDGHMLGDGHVRCKTFYQGRYVHHSKFKEYIMWLKECFEEQGVRTSKIYERDLSAKTFSFNTISTKQLGEERVRWYGHNKTGKKRVPSDIRINPTSVLRWYLDDGCLQTKTGRNKNNKRIVLHTNGFMKSEVDFLINKLNRTIPNFKASYYKSLNCIYIKDRFVVPFLSYIGKCPISCYNYKWII